MIEKALIDEILQRTDMESLISSYVSLRRAGPILKGLCPFHSEKTPSFTVYPAENNFYCFGCGAGGTAITFVRRVENLDFEESVRFLARRVGITVPTEPFHSDGKKYDRSKLLAMNKEAGRYFHACLFSSDPEADSAKKYFTEKRGLSLATIKRFGLGYAPRDSRPFYRHMREKGFTDEELIAGFLFGKRDNGGGLYASFWNRVMFPIIDVSGNVIAFGGRVLEEGVANKYKNSSDTPVFEKRKNIFALNYARQFCADSMILCEGYMDVIALHSAGFQNAVATLGTAITPEQARLMHRYTKHVIIAYDSDAAGQKATTKAMKLLEEVGLTVTVLKMTGAKDPDEYIKKFGKDAFAHLLSESRTKFEFNMDKTFSKYDIRVPQQKIDACSELCQVISQVYSSAEREIYIRELAKRLELDPKSVAADVEKNLRKNKKKANAEQKEKMHRSAAGFADRVNPDFAKAPSVAHAEEAVLGMLLQFSEYRARIYETPPILTEAHFYTEFGKKVFTYIKEHGEDALSDAELETAFSVDEISRLIRIRMRRASLAQNGPEVFADIVAHLKSLKDKKDMDVSVTSALDLQQLIQRKRDETT